jgi:hexosaminidase
LALAAFAGRPAPAQVGAPVGAPASVGSAAGAASAIAVVPRPARVTERAGRFALTARSVIWTDAGGADAGSAEVAAVGRQLARYLEPATGFALAVRAGAPPAAGAAAGAIVLRRDPSLARLGPEGYVLDVAPGRVTARAPGAAGLFYAVQTIRQLLPPEALRAAPLGDPDATAWTMPAVRIEDAPRFRWRGGMLDVARHFMPKEFVKKYVDLLALHKLNTFHWHLTDDQGWRLEVKKYPRLTEVGARRAMTVAGRQARGDSTRWAYDSVPHGGFYTQDDVREVVAYAAARHVTVVPEIEMPGHAVAAIAAYPALGVTGGPTAVAGRWGVFDNILNAEPGTVAFMQDVLTEVLALFPGPYVHVGGDEADKTRWRADARTQARIRALGLRDEHELQSWFIRQMDAFLAERGRRLVGWDEILEGGLAPNATVMSWRGTAGGVAAARAGHDVVMSPTSHVYLDYVQSQDRAAEPVGPGAVLPLDTVYAFEPVPAELTPRRRAACWAPRATCGRSTCPRPSGRSTCSIPRLSALAEVAWTPSARKDFADFRRRLVVHARRLDALDVNYRPTRP